MAIGTADDYIRLPDGSLKRNPASLPSHIINSIEKEQDMRETSDITPIILEPPDIAWQGLFKDYRNLVSETTEAAHVFIMLLSARCWDQHWAGGCMSGMPEGHIQTSMFALWVGVT